MTPPTSRTTNGPKNGQRIRACIYARISLARFGDTTKVDDQEQICRRLAAVKGWQVSDAHVFRDNSKSAWKADRKRPGWDAMLEVVTAGRVDAIIVYHGDRLVRAPRDLEDLIDLAQKRGILLASPIGTRDLGNHDDQFILRIEAAAAHREVAATSRRTKAANDRRAEQGYVRLGGRGGRAFGFEPDGLTIVDADAKMIREAARRVLLGEPVGVICRDLNARGYVTTTGGPWTHGTLKKLLLRPRLVGLVEHHGVIVGPAAWPAILPRETWEAVRAVLEHKAGGFGYATNARRHLLSGIAVCGSCGQTLAIRQAGRRRATSQGGASRSTLLSYGCVNDLCGGKVNRVAHHLDTYVTGATIALLNNPKVRRRMSAGDTARAAKLVTKLAELQARREQVLAEFADDPDMAADVLRVTVKRLDGQMVDVRAQIVATQKPTVLDGLWGIDDDGWEALGLSRQRAAVSSLLKITVLSARRGPGFDPSTVRLDPV